MFFVCYLRLNIILMLLKFKDLHVIEINDSLVIEINDSHGLKTNDSLVIEV